MGGSVVAKVSSNGITVLENWYDAGSRRLAKKDAAYALYLWDGWESVAVLNQSAVAQEIFTRGVGIAGDIGTLVAITKLSTPAIYYAHHNHRGDVTTVRSGASTVSGYSYSAFGLQTSAFGSDVCRFKFSSKEREPSCGWSYYGYRFYAPQWQRWLSRDKAGKTNLENMYEFSNASPLHHVDPDGRAAIALLVVIPVLIVTTICYLIPSCRDALTRATKNPVQSVVKYCSTVADYKKGKEECIDECSDRSLPTAGSGYTFWNCVKDCFAERGFEGVPY